MTDALVKNSDGTPIEPWLCGSYCIIMTVTAKGKITLTKEMMEHLGVRPGEIISITPSKTSKSILISAANNKNPQSK